MRSGAGMNAFQPYTPDEALLLPPAVQGWLPADRLALFISDVVAPALDFTPILASYETGGGRGQPPYHPALLVKLRVSGYGTGQPSWRRPSRSMRPWRATRRSSWRRP